ncbi:MAG: F-box protein [Alphaproteobacteria bacterium]
MSSCLTFFALLKLVLIALLMPQMAFSTGSVKIPSFFEWLPSEIIKLILEKLPKKDQLSLRVVNKKLKDMVTPFITNLEIPGNLPSEEQAKKFFKDLSTDKFWEGKKPSGAFANLFRHAPLEALYFTGKTINAETFPTIAPILPIGLKILSLNESTIGDAGAQALALHLPNDLQWLWLEKNNIGDAGALALASHLPAPLQDLRLGGNKIGNAGAQALALHLPNDLQWLWLNENAIGGAGAQALASHLPITLQWFYLNENVIGDAGFSALLGAIPRTDLTYLSIPAPSSSPLREQFKNLRNRQGNSVTVDFK